jgi:hypothetical protein
MVRFDEVQAYVPQVSCEVVKSSLDEIVQKVTQTLVFEWAWFSKPVCVGVLMQGDSPNAER